ncbi:hypothetical protein AcV7_002740 [Taiwanofungus camphoratus]|nr:hypothetical protein AcV7_002740 [Antrodia cinnamomea]
MAPRNATTPLSPLSPDPDQAPGLSRSPSFLGFAPKCAPWPRSTTPSHSQTKGSASARPARSSGANRGERPVELQDLWECLEHGSRGSLGAGGLAFAIPSGVNPILRMT